MTGLIYVNTSKQIRDPDHIKVFANTDAAETWFEETTPLAGAKVTSPVVQGEPFSLEKYLFGRQPQQAAE